MPEIPTANTAYSTGYSAYKSGKSKSFKSIAENETVYGHYPRSIRHSLVTTVPSPLPEGVSSGFKCFNPFKSLRRKKHEDVAYLIAFVLNLIILLIVAQYAIRIGDPGRYVYGVDSWGNVCSRKINDPIPGVRLSGRSMDNQTFAFKMSSNDIRLLVFSENLLQKKVFPVLCIGECVPEITKCQTLLADNGYDLDKDFIDNEVCTMIESTILPQRQYFRNCIPEKLHEVKIASLVEALKQQRNGRAIRAATGRSVKPPPQNFHLLNVLFPSVYINQNDMVTLILISLLITSAFAIATLIWPRFLLVPLCFVVTLTVIVLMGIMWNRYSSVPMAEQAALDEAEKLSSDGNIFDKISGIDDKNLLEILNSLIIYSNEYLNYLYPIALFLTFLSIVCLIGLSWCFLRDYQQIVGIFLEAMKCYVDMPCILLQVVITLVGVTLVLLYFLFVTAYIISTQLPEIDQNQMVFFVPNRDIPIWLLLVPHVMGCLWVLQFVYGCQDIVISGAVCKWYFTRNKEKFSLTLEPVLQPTFALIRYNLGSVAFLSLTITPVRYLRNCVRSMRITKVEVDERELHRPKTRLGRIEKICNVISRITYVCIAIYGVAIHNVGRCEAALFGGHIFLIMELSRAFGFCLFCCKLGSSLLTLFVSYIWFRGKFGYNAHFVDYLFPVLIVTVVAYYFSACIFNLFGITFDTIFFCYFEDKRINQDTNLKLYCSDKLYQLMEKAFPHPRARVDARDEEPIVKPKTQPVLEKPPQPKSEYEVPSEYIKIYGENSGYKFNFSMHNSKTN